MPMERLQETAAPFGGDPTAGGTEILLRRRSVPMERLRGTTAASLPGSPAEAAVGAYGAAKWRPLAARTHHFRATTKWGDGESCLGGGQSLWSVSKARRPLVA